MVPKKGTKLDCVVENLLQSSSAMALVVILGSPFCNLWSTAIFPSKERDLSFLQSWWVCLRCQIGSAIRLERRKGAMDAKSALGTERNKKFHFLLSSFPPFLLSSLAHFEVSRLQIENHDGVAISLSALCNKLQ